MHMRTIRRPATLSVIAGIASALCWLSCNPASDDPSDGGPGTWTVTATVNGSGFSARAAVGSVAWDAQAGYDILTLTAIQVSGSKEIFITANIPPNATTPFSVPLGIETGGSGTAAWGFITYSAGSELYMTDSRTDSLKITRWRVGASSSDKGEAEGTFSCTATGSGSATAVITNGRIEMN